MCAANKADPLTHSHTHTERRAHKHDVGVGVPIAEAVRQPGISMCLGPDNVKNCLCSNAFTLFAMCVHNGQKPHPPTHSRTVATSLRIPAPLLPYLFARRTRFCPTDWPDSRCVIFTSLCLGVGLNTIFIGSPHGCSRDPVALFTVDISMTLFYA